MDGDTLVSMQNERLERAQHAEKAGGYLYYQKDALHILAEVVRANGDGRYTYAMQGLLMYIQRLCQDARHHVEGAQGIADGDIPF